jgi:MATE family multidrug resistance protein
MALLMGVWGWWAFDIFTLMASYLATEIISAQTIMRSLGLLTYMIPVGFSKACFYYTGFFIGQGCSKSIQHYYNTAMLMSVIVGVFQIILLLILREPILNMYTDKEELKEQMRLAWGIFMVFVFFDTTQGIGSSAIRASGKQGMGALITGIAYWGLGIPVSCLLVFW